MSCGRILSALKIKLKQLKWWTGMYNTNCKSFCPACKYYKLCVKDTLYEVAIENLADAVWDCNEEVIRAEIEKWL